MQVELRTTPPSPCQKWKRHLSGHPARLAVTGRSDHIAGRGRKWSPTALTTKFPGTSRLHLGVSHSPHGAGPVLLAGAGDPGVEVLAHVQRGLLPQVLAGAREEAQRSWPSSRRHAARGRGGEGTSQEQQPQLAPTGPGRPPAPTPPPPRLPDGAPTWGSSARTRSLRTGARRFILPAAWRGAPRRRGGRIRPGDPHPRRPDDHPRPRRPNYNAGPRGADRGPRPRGRRGRCGPRGRGGHPGLRRPHDHPRPGRPEDDSRARRPLGRQSGAGSPVRGTPGARRPHDNSGPDTPHNHSRPRRPDDNSRGRRPHHNRPARGWGRPRRPGPCGQGREAGSEGCGRGGGPVRRRRAPRPAPLPSASAVTRSPEIPGQGPPPAPLPAAPGLAPRPRLPVLSSSPLCPGSGCPARRLLGDPGRPRPPCGNLPREGPPRGLCPAPGCGAAPPQDPYPAELVMGLGGGCAASGRARRRGKGEKGPKERRCFPPPQAQDVTHSLPARPSALGGGRGAGGGVSGVPEAELGAHLGERRPRCGVLPSKAAVQMEGWEAEDQAASRDGG